MTKDGHATWPRGQDAPFGERLRHLREAAGLTQEELAERSGLSAKGISDLERGERRRPTRTPCAPRCCAGAARGRACRPLRGGPQAGRREPLLPGGRSEVSPAGATRRSWAGSETWKR